MNPVTQTDEIVSRLITEETLARLDKRMEYLRSAMEEPLDIQSSMSSAMTRQDPWVASFDGAYAMSELYWSYRKLAEMATTRQEILEEVMKGLAEACPVRLTAGKQTIWVKFGDTLLRIIDMAGRTKYDMEMLFRENPAAKRRKETYVQQGDGYKQNKFELDFRGR